ncbi:hypothetical protein [Nostoc sp. LPT]|uniref:hypothetical protein n=1 Tax=Nostoc sp. LPT TaxID=2815387 RepID=UPI001D98B716|nr:hypothetical protein [Nostoc sp. LPT]MBN4004313.1 hypothetical protein [Nostoc sp. LPT]
MTEVKADYLTRFKPIFNALAGKPVRGDCKKNISNYAKLITVIASVRAASRREAKQSQPQANCFISLRYIRNDIM